MVVPEIGGYYGRRTGSGVSNSHLEKRRAGRLASWASLRRRLHGRAGGVVWFYRGKPYIVRLHLALSTVPEHTRRPASDGRPPLKKVVSTVRRSNMERELASSLVHHGAIEFGARTHLRQAGWAAAAEFFRHRSVDGLSAICAVCASDHGELWYDDGLSLVPPLVITDKA